MKNTSKTTEEKAYTTGEVGSMIERFEGSLKAVSENTDKKIGQLGSIVERFDEKLSILAESMDIKFENVNQRFDAVDKRFDGIDNRLELVETKIDRLQDDMVEVKFELKRKVDAEVFEKLEKRVVKLENLSLSHQS